MAEQRGYFIACEWAQGGCTTLYQLPEEGNTVLLLLNNFHLCVVFFSPLFQSHWTLAEALEQAYVQVDPFYSTAKSLIMPYVARGSRFSVRTQRPSLLMVCIMFGLRFSSRLNTNTAVKWIIHSSGESISEQQLLPARRQAFPLYLSLNGSWHCHECCPARLLYTD